MSSINVNTIKSRLGGPPTLPSGVVVSAAATFSNDVSIGGTLTYEDVTNIDAVGLITARNGVQFGVAGVGGTIRANGDTTLAGVVTASSFVGDGSGLTNLVGAGVTNNVNTVNLNVISGISTFGGDLSIADKIIHTGDTNTAIRFPAADTVTAETGGSERLRIDSSGLIANNARVPSNYGSPNLLISGTDSTLTLMGDGSTNSTSYAGIKFRVAGTSYGDYTKAGIFSRREGGYNDLSIIFALNTDANANSVAISDEKLRITSTGQVGVNTTTNLNAGAMTLYAADIGEGTAKGQLELKDTAAFGSTPTGGIIFSGHHASASGQAIFAGIRGFKANTSDGNYAGSLAFDVRAQGAVAYEAMRIDDGGDIGIGTITPQQRLQIHSVGSGAANQVFTNDTTGSAASDGFVVGLTGAEKGQIFNQENTDVIFGTNNLTRFTLTAGGGFKFANAELVERVKITAGKLSDNTNIDLENGMVHYFTTQETTTSTPNIRVNSSTTLNSVMDAGDVITVTLITTAAAGGYSANLTIDGNAVTEEWAGGEAPSEGGSDGLDIYSYTIICTHATNTGDSGFKVIGNLTNASN